MAILALYIIRNKKLLAFDKEGRPDMKKKPQVIIPETIPDNTLNKPD